MTLTFYLIGLFVAIFISLIAVEVMILQGFFHYTWWESSYPEQKEKREINEVRILAVLYCMLWPLSLSIIATVFFAIACYKVIKFLIKRIAKLISDMILKLYKEA